MHKHYFLILFLFTKSLIAQSYSCFDLNFILGKKLFNEKKYSEANVCFENALNRCIEKRKDTDIKDWYLNSQKELIRFIEDTLSKTILNDSILIKKEQSSHFLNYGLLFQNVDPTMSFRLLHKANMLDKNPLNSNVLADFYKKNVGSFYSKQIDQTRVKSIKLLPGDSLCLAGDVYRRIYLWNLRTGKSELVFRQDFRQIYSNEEDEVNSDFGPGGDVIFSIALNSSGKKILTASNNEVLYWDLSNKKFIKKFDFYESDVEKVSFINDRFFIAKVRKRDTISIKTYSTEKDICVNTLLPKNYTFYDFVTIPNTKIFITSSSDSICNFWSLDQEKPIYSLKTAQAILSMAYCNKNGLIAFGGEGGKIFIFDLHLKNIIREIPIVNGLITAISMNDRKIVCVVNYESIYTFDYLNENSPPKLTQHKVKANFANIVEMSSSKDAFLSYTCTMGGSHTGAAYETDTYIRYWNIDKTSLIKKDTIKINRKSAVLLDFKRKISFIDESISINNIFYIADLNTGKIIDSIKENSKIFNLNVSPNLKFLSYQLFDKTVKIFDLNKCEVIFEKKLEYYLKALAINDIKNHILMIKKGKRDLYEVWSIDSILCKKLIEHKEIAYGASFSKNGEYLVVYGWNYFPNESVSVYETDLYSDITTFGESGHSSNNAIISNSGEYVFNIGVRNTIFNRDLSFDLRDAKTGQIISDIHLDLDDNYIFSPGINENEIFLLAENQEMIYTWSLPNGLNQTIKKGYICEFDDSFFEFENLFSEYKY
jgi:WD40 repeat protein